MNTNRLLRNRVGAAAVALLATLTTSVLAGPTTSASSGRNRLAAASTTAVTGTVQDRAAAAGPYQLVNRLSNKCLTQHGLGDGGIVTQFSCNGSGRQRWRLNTNPGVAGKIVNDETGKCLELWGNGHSNALLVFAQTCSASPAQSWRTIHRGAQYNELRPHYTDKCLDLAGDSRADGAVIQQWGCNVGANNNQQWWIG